MDAGFNSIGDFCSETRFFGYDSESKKYDAAAHRDRIFGKHVAEYMELLKEQDEEAYKRHFSKFIANGVTPENVGLLTSYCFYQKPKRKWRVVSSVA